MATNPLFEPPQQPTDNQDGGYVLPGNTTHLAPLSGPLGNAPPSSAVELIRQKVATLFLAEPDAQRELTDAGLVRPRSKYQQYMYDLSISGRSLAEIQTAWHEYYVGLTDAEKHQVWQEFYAANERSKVQTAVAASATAQPAGPAAQPGSGTFALPTAVVSTHITPAIDKPRRVRAKDIRSAKDIKDAIVHHATAGGKLRRKHHLQSLAFGIGSGLIVLVVFLFGFFNEVIIAPFIQPSRTASATPIIVDPSSVTASSTPEVTIPKINVEIPVDYSQTTTNEAAIETALENGVVHYPSTVMPGQSGNTALFGHSSNNIFNKGKYKFAFVLLHELVVGDTFYLTNNGKAYIYKVTSKTIVDPSEVSVLNDIPGKAATATLITCDPPGTSLHRLVVVGDQISPDPAGNSTGSNTTASAVSASDQLPGNGPTLLGRFWRWLF